MPVRGLGSGMSMTYLTREQAYSGNEIGDLWHPTVITKFNKNIPKITKATKLQIIATAIQINFSTAVFQQNLCAQTIRKFFVFFQ
jgi:hypothetical protein